MNKPDEESRILQPLIKSILVLAMTASVVSAQSPQLEEGKKFFDAQKYAEAAQVLTPIGKTDAHAAYLLGRIALYQDDGRRGADWLEKAVQLNPQSSVYYDWLGRAYASQAEKASKLKLPFLAKKTRSAWEKAIALDPDNLDARLDMVQFYLRAPGFLGGGKDKARQAALEIRKRSVYRGGLAVANVCAEVKDVACVEREMRSVISSFPDSSAGYTLFAAYYANGKQYDKAFAIIESRLKTKPDDPAALYSFGRTASVSGQNLERGEQALRAYIAKPLANGPGVDNAHYRLGLIAEKRGARDVARREYQTAIRLNPGYDEAKKALAALGS